MKKINLRLRKDTRIITAESDTHNYITNSHWAIKYNKHINTNELFTRGTNNKLKEYRDKIEVIDHHKIQGLYDNIINNPSDDILQDTGFFEQASHRSRDLIKIFYTRGGGFQYFNNDYIKLLSDDLIKFEIYHLSHAWRPIVFKHRQIDVTFLITPLRNPSDRGRFKIEPK